MASVCRAGAACRSKRCRSTMPKLTQTGPPVLRASSALSLTRVRACVRGVTGDPVDAQGACAASLTFTTPSPCATTAEDLHLLSRCTRMALTGTSRYGAIAVALSWAHSGGASVPATVMLDAGAYVWRRCKELGLKFGSADGHGSAHMRLSLLHRPATAAVCCRSSNPASGAIERGELQSGWVHWTMPDMARGAPGEQWRNFTRM
jgi:hypothetical protein